MEWPGPNGAPWLGWAGGRYRGYAGRGVTELPYFSVMEFGGTKYQMQCLPAPGAQQASTAPPAPQAPHALHAPQAAPPAPPTSAGAGAVPRLVRPAHAHDPSNPACQGPVNIQSCTAPDAGSMLRWDVVPVGGGAVQLQLYPNHQVNPEGATEGTRQEQDRGRGQDPDEDKDKDEEKDRGQGRAENGGRRQGLGGRGGAAVGGALCLTAVHGSQFHSTNDELDALPCNTSNPAQRWIWQVTPALLHPFPLIPALLLFFLRHFSLPELRQDTQPGSMLGCQATRPASRPAQLELAQLKLAPVPVVRLGCPVRAHVNRRELPQTAPCTDVCTMCQN